MSLDPFCDLASILDHIPGYVCVFDRDRRLRWINRTAYGHAADAIGQRAEEYILAEDRPEWLHAVRLALDDGTITQSVVRVQQPDGGPVMRMLYRVGPLRQDTKIVGAVIVNWDATFAREPLPLTAFLLTPRCRRIVELLHARGACKGAVIGRHLGEMSSNGKQAASKVRAILAGLEERNVIRNTQQGYAVTAEFTSAYANYPPP